jgi:hypothetical protein
MRTEARISILAGRRPPRPDTLKQTDQPPTSTKPLADGAGHTSSTLYAQSGPSEGTRTRRERGLGSQAALNPSESLCRGTSDTVEFGCVAPNDDRLYTQAARCPRDMLADVNRWPRRSSETATSRSPRSPVAGRLVSQPQNPLILPAPSRLWRLGKMGPRCNASDGDGGSLGRTGGFSNVPSRSSPIQMHDRRFRSDRTNLYAATDSALASNGFPRCKHHPGDPRQLVGQGDDATLGWVLRINSFAHRPSGVSRSAIWGSAARAP